MTCTRLVIGYSLDLSRGNALHVNQATPEPDPGPLAEKSEISTRFF